MISASRVVVGGDKPYEGVHIMLPGDELDTAEVNKILGDDKTVVLKVQGTDRTPRWVFTHSQNLSLIILNNLIRRGGSAGVAFERIVVGNASFGAGTIVSEEAYETIGVDKVLLDSGVFEDPLVFVVQEGLCICNAASITIIESVALAPKAKKSEMPSVTNEPLPSMQSYTPEGPTDEQVERGEAQKAALAEQHGGPLRGAGIGGNQTFSEVGTDQYGDPVSRDITRSVVQDPGPGREGGPVNPSQEFDVTKRGDTGDGHGKNFGAPEGLRGELYGQPGASADRASNFTDQAPAQKAETIPVTNAQSIADAPADVRATAALTEATAKTSRPEDAVRSLVEAKPVSAPSTNQEEVDKSHMVKPQPPKPKTEAHKPKVEAKEATKDVKATDATKQAEAGIKPPTGSETDIAAAASPVPTPVPTPAPTPAPVKVDPAPGQGVEVK